jgi:hypothetical protein
MTDKWGRRLFKAGAVASLIIGVVHSISFLQKLLPVNDTEKQLLDLMSNYKFNLAGSFRSMDNLLTGFSMCFMLAALAFGGFDLLLSRERADLLKRAALMNICWLAAMTAVSLRYFFIVPTSFLVATLLIFVLAWWKLPADGPA